MKKSLPSESLRKMKVDCYRWNWSWKLSKLGFNFFEPSVCKFSYQLTISVLSGGIISRSLGTRSGWACTSWLKCFKRFWMWACATWICAKSKENGSLGLDWEWSSLAADTMARQTSCNHKREDRILAIWKCFRSANITKLPEGNQFYLHRNWYSYRVLCI